ncbi:Bgt-20629, partial [Blumeria graminis f. sp. tritici]
CQQTSPHTLSRSDTSTRFCNPQTRITLSLSQSPEPIFHPLFHPQQQHPLQLGSLWISAQLQPSQKPLGPLSTPPPTASLGLKQKNVLREHTVSKTSCVAGATTLATELEYAPKHAGIKISQGTRIKKL